MNAKTKSNSTETCESIKLGIDAHAKWYYVGRQVDGAAPQPVQKMTFEGLLHFVAKQKRLAGEVYTCRVSGACPLASWPSGPGVMGFSTARFIPSLETRRLTPFHC
tara:strand:- start:3295 stop:3612 length:318 start_codon:yes stop_codon:yes gene_type:complete